MNAQENFAANFRMRRDATEILKDQGEAIREKFGVQQPPPEHPQPKEQTLFDAYAKPDEIKAVRAAHARIAAAQAEVDTVRAKLRQVDRELLEVRISSVNDADHAAAVALGEATDLPVARSVASGSQLELQRTGLERRIAAGNAQVEDRRGEFRSAVHDLVRQCVIRCAEDYNELTRRQGWCWQMMALGQQLTGDSHHRLVDEVMWNKYHVPGTPHIPVLASQSRDEYGYPVLLSADNLRRKASEVLNKLREQGRTHFGDWPL
jgi:hypothetical protein